MRTTPVRRLLTTVLASIPLLALAACQHEDLPGLAQLEAEVSEAMAAALADDATRENVHQAMQASPFIDHKLVLQEYLESEEGAPLRAALTDALGGEAAYRNTIDELPSDMDFYVPYEEHRATWEHAQEDLLVVTTFDPNADEGTAYRPDGTSIHLTSKEEILAAAEGALFVLHPAEAKAEHGHAPHDGATIEHPDARDHDVNGLTTASERGVFMASYYFYDCDGLYNNTCEVYFKIINAGQPEARTDPFFVPEETRVNGADLRITPFLPWYEPGPTDTNPVYLWVWEDDGDSNPDDYIGEKFVYGDGTATFQYTSFALDVRPGPIECDYGAGETCL